MKTQINTKSLMPTRYLGNKIFMPNTRLYCSKKDDIIDVGNDSEPNAIDYFKFAEKVNGRSAMQGFVWGSVGTAMSGKSVGQQLIAGDATNGYYLEPNALLGISLVVGLVTLGTALTSIISPDNELIEKSSKYNIRGFTPKAELTNGRLAMLGFIAMLVSGAFIAN